MDARNNDYETQKPATQRQQEEANDIMDFELMDQDGDDSGQQGDQPVINDKDGKNDSITDVDTGGATYGTGSSTRTVTGNTRTVTGDNGASSSSSSTSKRPEEGREETRDPTTLAELAREHKR